MINILLRLVVPLARGSAARSGCFFLRTRKYSRHYCFSINPDLRYLSFPQRERARERGREELLLCDSRLTSAGQSWHFSFNLTLMMSQIPIYLGSSWTGGGACKRTLWTFRYESNIPDGIPNAISWNDDCSGDVNKIVRKEETTEKAKNCENRRRRQPDNVLGALPSTESVVCGQNII